MGLDKVGKYKILAKIGEGAMGEVYRAHDPFLNRHVAIKTINPSFGRDAHFLKRFEREAQAAAQLNHPHIITVYDFGEEQGITYIVMELLEGHDLRDAISAGHFVSLRDKLGLMQQVCDGVAYAHTKGIIHRDLKPGNIHIQPNGQAKVLDFGLARVPTSEMTRAGTVLGTPHYMSPEQVRGETADARSDVFSLGAIFYELLTGWRPFAEDSSERIYKRILEEEVTPIRQWAPQTPDLVAAVVERALSKDPAKRYANAGAMAAMLRRVQQSLPPRLLQGDPGATRWDEAEETLIAGDGSTLTMQGATAGDVAGSTALAPERAAEAQTITTARPASTAVGAATQPAPPSRPWLWGVVGVLVVVLGVVAWIVLWRSPATLAPDEVAKERVDILTEALVTSQIELAREDFNNRDYEAAVQRAERALELSPQSADAKDLLDLARRTLQERDAAVQQARAAFEAGDVEGATQALGRVMSLDPRHPVIGELSSALNERFRQQAESARGEARTARAAAEREDASQVDGFSTAERLQREAAALFGQEEFTSAAQKYIQARDAFESARRAARVARATPPPTPAPAPTAVARAATPVPATPTPATTPRAATPEPSRPEPTPARVAAARPRPPVAAPAVSTTPDPASAVRDVIAAYERSFETHDLGLFRSIKPNLSSDEEKGLRKAFDQIKDWQLEFTIQSVNIDGDRAVVTTSRHDTLDGREMPPKKQVFRLARQGGAWRIASLEFPR
jgi:tRNA A-37 threonylcarbamoyl transferase component Bud32/tetratricopeptide (TPR) repeat protein